MKSRLTTHDTVLLVKELEKKFLGLRLDQVYDIDSKTYLLRFTDPNGPKKVLLLESGSRFHSTQFEWPKNPAPSGFSMKLRKHLSNKRLEAIRQLGPADRVVEFQFGQAEFTFRLILEVYDKGNVILADKDWNILSLVRPHGSGEERIATHGTYAVDKLKSQFSLTMDQTLEILGSSPGRTIREAFLSKIEFGPSLLAFVLKEESGLAMNTKIPAMESDPEFGNKLFRALERGRVILESGGGAIESPGGFITLRPSPSSDPTLQIYDQFHPMILAPTFKPELIVPFETLDSAIDDYFSKIQSQKIELKQVTAKKQALDKLERVKEDQRSRLAELEGSQTTDRRKAELIMFNQGAVDGGIAILRQLIANQLPWKEIEEQVKEAQKNGDPLAMQITGLNLIKNQFKMKLCDPYDDSSPPLEIDLNLDLSAYANATKYFDLKKSSALKASRTLESQAKALKSTEKKTQESLREISTIQSIKKARKVHWWEKFHWFISSENYLVLGGRDAGQNEQLVKRYMGPKDVYLHAEAHGSPSIIIKNDGSGPVLPKTLNEAGTLGICVSGAWDTKIIPAVWWVWGDQVSKSAPTGEYLPTGSFMIRGKKNFLPSLQLVLGFGFLFKLSEESVASGRHSGERSRRAVTLSESSSVFTADTSAAEGEADGEVEIPVSDSSDDEEESAFPDTKVELGAGALRTRTRSSVGTSISEDGQTAAGSSEVYESTFATKIDTGHLKSISVDATKLTQQQRKKKQQQKNQEKKGMGPPPAPVPVAPPAQTASGTSGPKRGQHGRKKKLKEKYKFQDDEERELRMKLLQPKVSGPVPIVPVAPIPEAAVSSVNEGTHNEQGDTSKVPVPTRKERPNPVVIDADYEEESGAAGQGQLSQPVIEMETTVLSTLTGSPDPEVDELLYAIPVLGPYSAMTNYKFRVKLIPGATKRGKGARSALEYFLRDKGTSPRERDLLKSVKDQDLAKNWPGKVKLSINTRTNVAGYKK